MGKRAHETQAQVLAVLRRNRGPMSAYDVLGDLRRTKPKIAAPTVYRALAALGERGIVHRIESMNAFIACQCRDHEHASILSICTDCGTVRESLAPELLTYLSKSVGQSGFAATRHVVELHGRCAECRQQEPHA